MRTIETEPDRDWDALTALWRDDAGAPSGARERLHRRVARDTRRLWIIAAAQGAMLLGIAWLTRSVFATWPPLAALSWAAGVWVFAAIAVTYSLRNWWGLTRPASAATAAHLTLSLGRARARLRAARAVQLLVAVQLIVVVPFVLWAIIATGASSLPHAMKVYGLSALVGAVYIAWSLWQRASARRELAELTALEAVLRD